MRLFSIKIIILIVVVVFAGCENLLEEKPKSFLEQELYYQNESQAISGVNGIYSIMTNPGGYNFFYRVAEIPTDEGKTGGVYQPSEPVLVGLDEFSFNASNRFLDQIWQNFYRGINRANLAIAKIPEIDEMNPDMKARLIGEAKFLRALYYFNLVRWFGDVPFVTDYTDNVEGLNLERTDKDKVYDLIISDLSQASEDLSVSYSGENIGRATKGAALTLLGKVYLTRENWSNASNTLKEVIDLGQYSLYENYEEVWDISNENGKEFIFSVQYKAGVINNPYSRRFAPRSSKIQASQSWGDIAPEAQLLNKYQDGDERLGIFKEEYEKYNSDEVVDFGWPFCFKFFDLAEGGNSGENFPVLRYADVLLMYAEAHNEINGPGDGSQYSALWALNEVRERSDINPISNTNKEEFREIVWAERSRELCFEGHRWFDLVRTDRLVQVMENTGVTVADKYTLFPIPQREMDINPNLEQNPGY